MDTKGIVGRYFSIDPVVACICKKRGVLRSPYSEILLFKNNLTAIVNFAIKFILNLRKMQYQFVKINFRALNTATKLEVWQQV